MTTSKRIAKGILIYPLRNVNALITGDHYEIYRNRENNYGILKVENFVSRYKTEPQALNINSKCAHSKGNIHLSQ